jgi:Transposase
MVKKMSDFSNSKYVTSRYSETAKLDCFWVEFSAAIPRLEEQRAMKVSRFSDARKAFILKQGADGMPVADFCRKAGISRATYFNWKKKYDGLLPRMRTASCGRLSLI